MSYRDDLEAAHNLIQSLRSEIDELKPKKSRPESDSAVNWVRTLGATLIVLVPSILILAFCVDTHNADVRLLRASLVRNTIRISCEQSCPKDTLDVKFKRETDVLIGCTCYRPNRTTNVNVILKH